MFRPATIADTSPLVDIYNHYVSTSTVTFDLDVWTADDMAHKIESVNAIGMPFIVAERDGEIVGYAYLSTFREKAAYDSTMENTLYLHENARGSGIGGALLEELCQLGARAGVREVVAVIADTPDAVPSIRLHDKAGFARVGAMDNVGRKFGEWIGIVMMQKSLARD
jgi:phosphinothricin acetyltransferase